MFEGSAMSEKCPSCDGTGKLFDDVTLCPNCDGYGLIPEHVTPRYKPAEDIPKRLQKEADREHEKLMSDPSWRHYGE